MENKVKNYRWPLMINGFIAFLFGIFMLLSSVVTTFMLVNIFGVMLMVGGLIGLLFANMSMKKHKPFISTLVISIFMILGGLILFFFTQASLVVFAMIIAFWATILALIQFMLAFQMKIVKKQKNILLINGLITLAFGLFMFFNPDQIFNPFETTVALGFLAGILAIIFGGVLVYFSIVVKHVEK
jgi:uncharacterized membrane protein HdeD (DUF308 family)